MQRACSGVEPDRETSAAISRKLLFECGNFASENELSARQNAGDRGIRLGFDPKVLRFQIKKRYCAAIVDGTLSHGPGLFMSGRPKHAHASGRKRRSASVARAGWEQAPETAKTSRWSPGLSRRNSTREVGKLRPPERNRAPRGAREARKVPALIGVPAGTLDPGTRCR